MSYSIQIDEEIAIGDKVYHVSLEADLEYSYPEDPEPTGVEITEADVSLVEGELLPLTYEGKWLEKVIVTDHPEATEAIDTLLWEKIQTHTEDNYQDLIRDLGEDTRDL